MDAAISIVTAAGNIIAAVAPGVLALATGKQTDEEAIAHLAESTRRLRNREDDGEWDEDLEDRKDG